MNTMTSREYVVALLLIATLKGLDVRAEGIHVLLVRQSYCFHFRPILVCVIAKQRLFIFYLCQSSGDGTNNGTMACIVGGKIQL